MGGQINAAVLCLAASLTAARAEITLTDIQNRKATVEIVEASPSELTVQVQGRRMPIKLEQLSAESRTAAIDYAKSKGVYRTFPAVSVQVKMAYQRRNTSGSYYEKDMKLLPSVVIEGHRKMEAIPAAEATIVIVTHDTRQKYVNHVDKMRVYAMETIPIDAGTGARREFQFKAVQTTFDSARDTTNVGGDEYRYFIFGLRDPSTKQLIDFQTNCPKLQAYIEKHPEARNTVLAPRRNAPFSEDFAAN